MQFIDYQMANELSINWEITKQCNLRCAYCRVSGGLPEKNELTLEQAKKVIDILKNNGFGHIKFTGGEPLIRKDFWEIVAYAHKKGFKVSLITNGVLINDKVLDLFKKYIYIVGLSLDSIQKKTNLALGRGDYKKVIEDVIKLREMNIHIVILSTITKLNQDQIPELLKVSRELRVDELKINDIVLNGRADENKFDLGMEHPLLESVGYLCDEVKKTNKTKVSFQKTFKCGCSADNLYITNNGDLYSCVEMFYNSKDFCLGNLTTDDPKRMFQINKKFYKQIKKEDVCSYSYVSSNGFSACLNRGACPNSLRIYMNDAKK